MIVVSLWDAMVRTSFWMLGFVLVAGFVVVAGSVLVGVAFVAAVCQGVAAWRRRREGSW